MFRALMLATAFVVVAPLTNAPAASQEELQQEPMTFCGDRGTMVEKLAAEFKENPMAVGVVDQNAVLEIFVSDKGSWTILATGTDGMSCVLSAGEGWESKSLVIGAGA